MYICMYISMQHMFFTIWMALQHVVNLLQFIVTIVSSSCSRVFFFIFLYPDIGSNNKNFCSFYNIVAQKEKHIATAAVVTISLAVYK